MKLLIDGVSLACRVVGPETAPVLVLSHSLGTAGALWQGQIEALAEHFRLVIPDHRGHGQSDAPDQSYDIDDFGRELVGLLDRLEIAEADFCGLSLGGMIGMWLAQRAPDRVNRLVLCNTAARIKNADLLQRRVEKLHKSDLESIADDVLQRWLTDTFRSQKPELAARFRDMLLGTPLHGYVQTSLAVCRLDLRPQLPAIRKPCLVVAGDHDQATPAGWTMEIADAVPGASRITLPTAHLSNVEACDEFNRLLVEFLRAPRSGLARR